MRPRQEKKETGLSVKLETSTGSQPWASALLSSLAGIYFSLGLSLSTLKRLWEPSKPIKYFGRQQLQKTTWGRHPPWTGERAGKPGFSPDSSGSGLALPIPQQPIRSSSDRAAWRTANSLKGHLVSKQVTWPTPDGKSPLESVAGRKGSRRFYLKNSLDEDSLSGCPTAEKAATNPDSPFTYLSYPPIIALPSQTVPYHLSLPVAQFAPATHVVQDEEGLFVARAGGRSWALVPAGMCGSVGWEICRTATTDSGHHISLLALHWAPGLVLTQNFRLRLHSCIPEGFHVQSPLL